MLSLLSLRWLAIGWMSWGAIALFSEAASSRPIPWHEASSPVQIAQATTPDAQADALLRQGAAQLQRRQVEAALQSWNEALELYRQSGNRIGEGRVLGNIGAVAEAVGNYPEAIAAFEDSLEVAREINDYQGIVFALNNLGHTHELLGNYEQALVYQEEALTLTQQRGDRAGEQHTLNALGILYASLGDYDRAITTYERSLELARAVGERQGEANVLGNLGNAYTERGNYPAAIATYDEALLLLQEIGNTQGEAGVLQRLGNLYMELGNSDRARTYYENSLTLARRIRDANLEAYNLGSLGILARIEGDPDTALTLLNDALQRLERLGDKEAISAALISLGNVYIDLADPMTAQQQFQQSLAIAQEIGDLRGESIALGSLALAADLSGDKEGAIARYRQSLEFSRRVGDRVREGQALSNMGIVQYELGILEDAAESLLAAVEIWETLRPGLSDADQVSLFETQAATYRILQMVLIDLKRFEDALEMSERGRARAFVELVAQRLSAVAAEALQTPPLTIADIRDLARDQNATLVEYALLENNRVAIWVVQPDGTVEFRESQLEEIDTAQLTVEDLAEETRVSAALGRGATTSTDRALTSLTRSTRQDITENRANPGEVPPVDIAIPRRASGNLMRLHSLLIEPIADLLPTDPSDRVIIIPQGSLFLVPFAALQNSDRQYLIERHTLMTAPAIHVLALTQSDGDRRDRPASLADLPALVVGNPVMPALGTPPEPLSPLPNAEVEAVQIGEMLEQPALLGSAATESAVVQRMSQARIIHLATHGLLDDVEGLGVPGAIALAPSRTTDGLLTANEILGLSLNADMVVLSACDTGRGRITGDGVIGLSRSFLSAGAESVVVSLWAVPDDATAALMTEFYRNLQTTPDRAQALRQAMLTTLQQYPSSRDWAAFTLMGNVD